MEIVQDSDFRMLVKDMHATVSYPEVFVIQA